MIGAALGEDGPIEWASAGLFAIAALTIVLRWRHLADLGWLRFYAAVLAAICCLSELSFGARLFGWSMPAMRGGGELDGAHDLVLLAWRAVSMSPLYLALAGFASALAGGIGARLVVRAGVTVQGLVHWVATDRRRALVALASAALAIALACDLLERPRTRLIEEPLELLGAALLALASWSSAHPVGRRQGRLALRRSG
ncbi:hypothetical protein RCO27_04185 [Sphingosinicella sp. LHD-64]|uniref:hypothetical protein n=1 Tax=Sphingosinicella sp. LHD-64 TaxID=3072139 RepID=UPI00280E252A|nr:hypothetical protein [Sphingosinicella sp. LHD-64]MDQ8755420.1 hypothetical protein [Sphingosinicella sp. LHD-64]